MLTRQLGNTDLQITPIGLGTWAIGGGGWDSAWGPQDDAQSTAAIHRALDLGINWIDTAAVYGLGHSEEVIGRALKERSERPYIFTKCSLVWDDRGEISNSLKAKSLRNEVENSLRRLQTDVIDLYQIHWPNPDPDIEEGWATLAKLKSEGKVRAIGVSNFNVEQLRRAQDVAPVDTLQPRYSLVHPEAEKDLLPFCQEHHIGVIVYSPMASGLLTGAMTRERIENLPEDDWRRNAPDFREPRLSRNLALADKLLDIGYIHSRTPGEVAVAWTLHNPAVSGAIVGGRGPDQVSQLVGAAEFRLTHLEAEEINGFLQENP